MYIHRPSGLTYLAHPRTASRSTGAALESIGFQKHRSHHGGPIPHDSKYEGLRYFSTVRNHWDTFASWHMLKGGAAKPGAIKREWIAKWVARHISKEPFYCRPQKLFYFFVDVKNVVPVHFNHIESDVDHILHVNNLPSIELPYISEKKRGKISTRELFSPDAADFVNWYFKEEIKRFGFVFE